MMVQMHAYSGQRHRHGLDRSLSLSLCGTDRPSPLVRRARPASAALGQLLSQRGQLARRHRQGPAPGQQ
jgi:hypothetical protein